MPKCLARIENKITGMHDGISGDVSGIMGNVDEITKAERENDSNIESYVKTED